MSNELMIIKTDEFTRIERELQECIDWANAHEVKDLASKKDASDHLHFLKLNKKAMEETKLLITKPFRDAVSAFNLSIKSLDDKADVAIKTLNAKFVKYIEKQERIAREEAEAQKQIEIARLKAEAELAQQAILDSAESAGDSTIIEAAIVNEQIVNKRIEQLQAQEVKVNTMPARGYTSSTSVRENWKASIADKKLALDWILKTERFELIDFNDMALNQLSKTKKQEVTENGIKFYCEKTTLTR